MHTIATATITPIGTTTLRRARSQLVYCRVSVARGRATADTDVVPCSVLPKDGPWHFGPDARGQSLLFACVLPERRGHPAIHRVLLTVGKSLLCRRQRYFQM